MIMLCTLLIGHGMTHYRILREELTGGWKKWMIQEMMSRSEWFGQWTAHENEKADCLSEEYYEGQ